jgi:hypothetical protein
MIGADTTFLVQLELIELPGTRLLTNFSNAKFCNRKSRSCSPRKFSPNSFTSLPTHAAFKSP